MSHVEANSKTKSNVKTGEEQVFSDNLKNNDDSGVKDIASRSGENSLEQIKEVQKENNMENEMENEMKKEKEREDEKKNEMENEMKKENEMEKEDEKKNEMEKEKEDEKKNEMEKKNEVEKEEEKKKEMEKENEIRKENEMEKENEIEVETGHGKETKIEGDDRKKKEQDMKKAEVSSRLDPDPDNDTDTDTGIGTGISGSVKEESNGDVAFNKTGLCGNDDEGDGDDGDVEDVEDDTDDNDDNDNSDDDDDSNQSEEYNSNMSDYDEPGMYGNESELKKITRTSQAQKKKIYDMHFGKNKEKTKDDANAKYNKGDYEGAVEIWERGLRSIDYVLSKKDELIEDKVKSFEKLHSIYCSNIAQGYMKLNNYSKCVKYSLQALEHDKENEKIYFRLAKGYFLLGEYDKAIQVLQDALQRKQVPALVNLLVVVKRKKELHLIKEKFMMKHIFQSLQKNPLTSNCDENGYYNNIKKRAVDLFTKLSRQIHYFISFIVLLASLVFNHCYDCFHSVVEKRKLKKK